MEQIPPPKEVKILETAEDIQERREQVSFCAQTEPAYRLRGRYRCCRKDGTLYNCFVWHFHDNYLSHGVRYKTATEVDFMHSLQNFEILIQISRYTKIHLMFLHITKVLKQIKSYLWKS